MKQSDAHLILKTVFLKADARNDVGLGGKGRIAVGKREKISVLNKQPKVLLK